MPSMGLKLKFDGTLAQKVGELTKRRVAVALREVARQVHAEAARGTPVKKGVLQAGWNIGIGAPDTRTPRRKQGATPVSDPEEVLARVKADDVVHVSNNVGYALKIEQGSKKSPPHAMARNAVATVTARLDAIVKQAAQT